MSEELRLLTQRAEAAVLEARRLWEENERWRKEATQQLQFMFEIGAEFRKRRATEYQAGV